MPLAYLADPWQKMKVHEEIEVILRPDNLAVKVSNFQFRMIMKGSKLIRINLIFPLSQVADEEMTDENKNGVSLLSSLNLY